MDNIISLCLVVGIACLLTLMVIVLFLNPIYQKYVRIKIVKTNVDAIIGEIGLVVERIDNDESKGLVRIGGQLWSAKAKYNDFIEKGEKVKAVSIEGVKIIVERI